MLHIYIIICSIAINSQYRYIIAYKIYYSILQISAKIMKVSGKERDLDMRTDRNYV